MKNKGSNLVILTIVLTFVVSCFSLQLSCPLVGSCLGHAMSKTTQYAIGDVKVCYGFTNLKGV
jgi:hypothetical protein